jgi:hypothetical protein
MHAFYWYSHVYIPYVAQSVHIVMEPEVFLSVWSRIPLFWDRTVFPTFRTDIKPSPSQNSANLIRKSNTFPEKVMDRLRHGFANPGNHIAVAIKFFYGGATYFGTLRRDLVSCITGLAHRILRCLRDFWEMCIPLDYVTF